MKQIEAGLPPLNSDETKVQWQMPEVVKLRAGAAEGGDNITIDGASSQS